MEYDLELFRLRLKIKEVNVKGSIEVLVVVGEGLRLFVGICKVISKL